MRELDLILQKLTGKSIDNFAEDVVAGKTQVQIIAEVAEHGRKEHEKSDVFLQAIKEISK